MWTRSGDQIHTARDMEDEYEHAQPVGTRQNIETWTKHANEGFNPDAMEQHPEHEFHQHETESGAATDSLTDHSTRL